LPNDVLLATETSILSEQFVAKTRADPLYSDIQELSPTLSLCSVSNNDREDQDKGKDKDKDKEKDKGPL